MCRLALLICLKALPRLKNTLGCLLPCRSDHPCAVVKQIDVKKIVVFRRKSTNLSSSFNVE
jgi:hypothetical protein